MRQVLPVPFGFGLDRTTGALSSNPQAFHDLRNVVLKEGRLVARGGMVSTGTPLSLLAGANVVGLFPFRAIKGAVAVVYDTDTRELSVVRLAANGEVVAGVGLWATLIEGTPLPRIVAAESKGLLFLAHDEPDYAFRAQTCYFDPQLNLPPTLPGGITNYGVLTLLTANLGGGTEQIRFRGVRAYLSHMWGWGHGATSRQNAPEILRFSEGANPTVWPKQYYIVVGGADEPITNAGAAGNVLAVLKQSESHRVFGDNPQNFGVRPIEQAHGTINGRMAQEIGGSLFYWSETGPRVTEGGYSTDLAIPLDLGGPEPATLAAAGLDRDGWSVYDPLQRLILWGFPAIEQGGATTRVYCLSLRDPQLFRFSYMELAQAVYSAGIGVEGQATMGGTGGQPVGWATNLIAVDAGVFENGRQVDLTWDNNSLVGGEWVTIWRRLEGGEWETVDQVYASGGTQTRRVAPRGLAWQALADYEVAAAYVGSNGGRTVGFEGDPDNWTHPNAANSKTTCITSCEAPVITSGFWQRTDAASHQIQVAVTLAEQGIEWRLEETTEPVGAWAEVEQYAEPSWPADQRPAQLVYVIPENDRTGYYNYRVRAYRDAKYSAYSNVQLILLGQTTPGDTSLQYWVFQDTNTNDFIVFLEDQPSNGQSYAKIQIDARPAGGSWTRVYEGGGQATAETLPIGPITSPATFDNVVVTEVRIRYGLLASGVWTYTGWSGVTSILLTNEAPPASPAAFLTAKYFGGIMDVSNAVVTFAAGGALGRLMYYQDHIPLFGENPTYAFLEVDGAQTGATFTDLAHVAMSEPEPTNPASWYVGWRNGSQSVLTGPDWDYDANTGVQAATIPVASFAINRAGGRAKISATPTADEVPKVIAGAPDTISVSAAGPGRIRVQWAENGAEPDCTYYIQVMWARVTPPYDAVMLATAVVQGGAAEVYGPDSGTQALPATGQDIKVRVFAGVLVTAPTNPVPGYYYFTEFNQVTYTMH